VSPSLNLVQKSAARVWEDLKRVWLFELIFVATLLLGVVPYPRSQTDIPNSWAIAYFVRPLACLAVVSVLVRCRLLKTDGGRKYWDSFVPTLFSVLLFTLFPLLTLYFAVLVTLGISPLDWLPAILWRQVAFCVYFLLPMLAATAAARNSLQLAIAVVLTGLGWLRPLHMLVSRHWTLEAIHWVICGFVICVAAAAVIGMRGAGVRRYLLWLTICIAEILCWFTVSVRPWSHSAPWEGFANKHVDLSTLQIEFDDSRAGTKPKQRPLASPIEVVIPVRLNNEPQGLAIEEHRSSFTIQGKSEIWHSGWLIHEAFERIGKPDSWFVLEVDPAFYRSNERFPVHVTVETVLTVIQRTRPDVKTHGNIANLSGFGQCRYVVTNTGGYPTTCFSPLFLANLFNGTLYLTYAI